MPEAPRLERRHITPYCRETLPALDTVALTSIKLAAE